MATVVAIITSIVVANATQTITTPNAAFISFNLAGGTSSAPITPASNRPVLIMGCVTTAGLQGLGQVTLFHIPSVGMLWVGLDLLGNVTKSPAPGALPTPQSTAGTLIVGIDKLLTGIEIQVASADTIKIQNGYGQTMAGNVTLIW